MRIGFVGLGIMGFPMVRRLLAAGYDVAVCDNGVADGARVRRFVDLSTVGSRTAATVSEALDRRGIAALDAPVSGGVAGADKGTLAVMVSGPRADFDVVEPVLETIGKPIFVSEKPGAAQTMKLVNNMLAVLPRTFDYGFATGLMVKDVRLYLEEAAALGLSTEIAEAVGRVWESALRDEGPESDFTCVVKPIEAAAGVIVEGKAR